MKQKILQIAVLVVLGSGAWYYLSHHEVPDNNSAVTQNSPQIFSSEKLGISFTYMLDQDADGQPDTTAVEIGDKVYIYYQTMKPEDGQWVQVFTKDPIPNIGNCHPR